MWVHIGFTTGIPWVQFSNTVPLPVNTVTVAGEGMTLYMFGYSVIPKNIKLLCYPSSCQPHRHVHNFFHIIHPLHILNLTKYCHMPETHGGGAKTCWWGASRMDGGWGGQNVLGWIRGGRCTWENPYTTLLVATHNTGLDMSERCLGTIGIINVQHAL